jgi:uncharacterized protein HemY
MSNLYLRYANVPSFIFHLSFTVLVLSFFIVFFLFYFILVYLFIYLFFFLPDCFRQFYTDNNFRKSDASTERTQGKTKSVTWPVCIF